MSKKQASPAQPSAGASDLVTLDRATYEQLVESAEELEDIRAYVAAKEHVADDEYITIDQAIAEYEEHTSQRRRAG
jgi:hypothetical protein